MHNEIAPSALVTGCAGFIGFHVCQCLLENGYRVIGVDSLSDYYDVELKKTRQSILLQDVNFCAVKGCIETPGLLKELFCDETPQVVIHLAAQAGVRYSIENPRSYLESNIIGTFELLEAARCRPPKHMLLASTSSAYGANIDMPYKETTKADHQVSFYAATKKATENMAHSYAHLYNIPITMFRFFTVYGPWGRPDMAPFKFTKALREGTPIDVFNHGKMRRDFTYIKDLVDAVKLLIEAVPIKPVNSKVDINDSLSPVAPFRVVNIGNSNAVELKEFMSAIEEATGQQAKCNFMPMQDGDVTVTWADVTLLKSLTGYIPQTSIKDGIKLFVEWYDQYYPETSA